MLLTKEQIKAVATGWVCAEEDEKGLIFHRLTKEQRDYYLPVNAHLHARAHGAASITLDFVTDADFVSVTADGLQWDTNDTYNSMDLFVNGEPQILGKMMHPESLLWPELTPIDPITLTTPLASGENRVTVYLPWNITTRILSVELSDGASIRPYPHKRRWVAFGDSITQGAITEHTSMTYVNRLARKLDAVVLNAAIAGDVFRDAGVLPHAFPKCDFVTVALGTNDFKSRKEAEFAHHMPAFFRNLAAEVGETPTYVLLPLWRGLEDEAPELELISLQCVRERIAAEAEKYPNMTVIDCQHFLPHEQEYYGDTTLLHPNAKGFHVYAEKLYEILKDKV